VALSVFISDYRVVKCDDADLYFSTHNPANMNSQIQAANSSYAVTAKKDSTKLTKPTAKFI